MTRQPTGAAALLALLTHEPAVQIDANRWPVSMDLERYRPTVASLIRARRSLRNAIRRLVRAHGGRVGPAAAALGVHPAVLRAGAQAVGLNLPSKAGRPTV